MANWDPDLNNVVLPLILPKLDKEIVGYHDDFMDAIRYNAFSGSAATGHPWLTSLKDHARLLSGDIKIPHQTNRCQECSHSQE